VDINLFVVNDCLRGIEIVEVSVGGEERSVSEDNNGISSFSFVIAIAGGIGG
jgi:hypothetical protein